jgi:hypothetical protein
LYGKLVTVLPPKSMRCTKTVWIVEAQVFYLDLSNPPGAKTMFNITEQFTYEILGLFCKLCLFRKLQMSSPVDNLSSNTEPVIYMLMPHSWTSLLWASMFLSSGADRHHSSSLEQEFARQVRSVQDHLNHVSMSFKFLE